MLFLTRERNTFNDFGRELAKILYKADGGDFNAIKRFVENTVIQNDDYMLKEREAFLRNTLIITKSTECRQANIYMNILMTQ